MRHCILHCDLNLDFSLRGLFRIQGKVYGLGHCFFKPSSWEQMRMGLAFFTSDRYLFILLHLHMALLTLLCTLYTFPLFENKRTIDIKRSQGMTYSTEF